MLSLVALSNVLTCSILQLLGLDLDTIKLLLPKPLRPIWVTPDSSLPSFPPEFVDFMPLVLVTASRVVKGEGVESEYIQGAGDDHEGWAAVSCIFLLRLCMVADNVTFQGIGPYAGYILGEPQTPTQGE